MNVPSRPKLHWLRLSGVPIFEQLQLEEALLRGDARNWCVFNDEAPDAIVLGISNRSNEHLSQMEVPVPVIRRFSGGGSVYIDKHTTFATFICNSDDVLVEPFPKHVLNWTETIYRDVFTDIPFNVRDNDYVIGEKKFGGNAQYMAKRRWLHHSTLLWDFDIHKMNSLAMPPRMPAYRQNRTHADFVCALKDHVSDRQCIEQRLQARLAESFDVVEVPIHEAMKLLEKPHRKATIKL